MEELGRCSTYLNVAGLGGAAGALAGSNHHVAGSRGGGGGAPGGAGHRGAPGGVGNTVIRAREGGGGTGRNEPCCPCRWIWRGSVGTERNRTPRYHSTRRRSNARSRSRHGLVTAPWDCLVAAPRCHRTKTLPPGATLLLFSPLLSRQVDARSPPPSQSRVCRGPPKLRGERRNLENLGCDRGHRCGPFWAETR
jgi:hypothetical protein